MDQIDAKLIMLLQQNARVSLKELAKEVFSPLRPYPPESKNWKKKVSSPDIVRKSIPSSWAITLQPLSTWNYNRHKKKYSTLLLRKSQM